MNAETITIGAESGELSGYYARPDGEGPYPALVVIHEISGLNDNIKDIARRFAEQGYAALAVDLFHGRNRAVCMLRFMGGSFAIAWACTDERLKVIAPYYSMNPRPMEAVARSCPVVASFPEKDFTARAGQRLKVALDGYGVPNDIKEYPGAKHSFFNDQGGNYDPAASEDAWTRTLAFFEEHIG
jgi:carboxymethylenebutenolidase